MVVAEVGEGEVLMIGVGAVARVLVDVLHITYARYGTFLALTSNFIQQMTFLQEGLLARFTCLIVNLNLILLWW